MSEHESIGAAAPDTEQDIETLLQAAMDTYVLAAMPKLRGAIALLHQSEAYDTDEDVTAAWSLLRSCLEDVGRINEAVDLAGTRYSAERKAGVQKLLERK